MENQDIWKLFIQNCDEDLLQTVKIFLFESELTVMNCVLMAAFAVQNEWYFSVESLVDVVKHYNPNYSEAKRKFILQVYEDISDPDVEYRAELYVLDIEKMCVLNLFGRAPCRGDNICWYPNFEHPECDHTEDVVDNGGGHVVFGYLK